MRCLQRSGGSGTFTYNTGISEAVIIMELFREIVVAVTLGNIFQITTGSKGGHAESFLKTKILLVENKTAEIFLGAFSKLVQNSRWLLHENTTIGRLYGTHGHGDISVAPMVGCVNTLTSK